MNIKKTLKKFKTESVEKFNTMTATITRYPLVITCDAFATIPDVVGTRQKNGTQAQVEDLLLSGTFLDPNQTLSKPAWASRISRIGILKKVAYI